MDYLITTTLPNLKEVNTVVIGTTEEKMNRLFLKLLNKYEVFSFVFCQISPEEKRMIREGVRYQTLQLDTLIETLKPYERTEDNPRAFPTQSTPNDIGEMAKGG